MQFEFDTDEQTINLRKHGIDLRDDDYVFLDTCRLDAADERKDYGEERQVVVGTVEDRLWVVVYTQRADAIRLISASNTNEREKNATTRFTLEDLPRNTAQAQALRQRLQRADAQAIYYSDTPELSDEWFLRAAREGQLAAPPVKNPISIKLDEDVLDYFKGQGTHYQTHINAVLRAYMQAQRIVQSK